MHFETKQKGEFAALLNQKMFVKLKFDYSLRDFY